LWWRRITTRRKGIQLDAGIPPNGTKPDRRAAMNRKNINAFAVKKLQRSFFGGFLFVFSPASRGSSHE